MPVELQQKLKDFIYNNIDTWKGTIVVTKTGEILTNVPLHLKTNHKLWSWSSYISRKKFWDKFRQFYGGGMLIRFKKDIKNKIVTFISVTNI